MGWLYINVTGLLGRFRGGIGVFPADRVKPLHCIIISVNMAEDDSSKGAPAQAAAQHPAIIPAAPVYSPGSVTIYSVPSAPYGYAVAPAPAAAGIAPGPEGADAGKGKKKLPEWALAVIIVVVVVSIVSATMVYAIAKLPHQDNTTTDRRHLEAAIASGGHYKTAVAYSYEDYAELTIGLFSSGGKKVDVFIMESDQYDDAYGHYTNETVFSAAKMWKNTASLNVTAYKDYSPARTLYLVVDNTDLPLLGDDAVPSGTATVTIDIVSVTVSALMMD